MIGRVFFPTPTHQILTILAIVLIASTSTTIYLTHDSLKNQEISPFGAGTFYAEYFYYEGFVSQKKVAWERALHNVTEKFPYLKIGNIFILNSTQAIVQVGDQPITLKPTQIMLTDTSIYNVSSFRFIDKKSTGEGIILGYEIYMALEEIGRVDKLKIKLINNQSTIFTCTGKVIGILSPTASNSLNAGILIVNKKLDSIKPIYFPKFVVFKVPPEYMEYMSALAEDIYYRGLPVVQPERSSNPLFFQSILNVAAIFSDLGLLFAITAYVMVSKRIWLKEMAIALLSGAGFFKILSWLFLRNLITVFLGIFVGTFIGVSFFSFIISRLPPTYYFYFTVSNNISGTLILNLSVSLVIIIATVLYVWRYTTKTTPIKIIREVFYQ